MPMVQNGFESDAHDGGRRGGEDPINRKTYDVGYENTRIILAQ
jgi:hypothetical protein